MKKFVICGCMGALLSLASCDQKDGFSSNSRQIFAPAISIITDLDDQSVIVKDGSYLFSLEMSTQNGMTGTIKSPELIANNSSLAFTTEVQNYESTGSDAFFKNVQGTVTGNSSLQLKNANLEILNRFDENINEYNGYYYTTENVGDLTWYINTLNPWITIGKFNLGDSYRVNTFQKETFFRGETTTVYPYNGEEQNYTTQDIIYRFIINADEKLTKFTATLVMYNAKFSSVAAEPTKTIVVRDLDVTFEASGIKITGENLIPEMYSGGEGFMPVERFKFNNFEFYTTDSYYIYGVINYKVADMYQGHFEGSYIKNTFLK